MKILLAILLGVQTLPLLAFRPFIEEGKYWRWTEYVPHQAGVYIPRRYVDYKMEGDSVIGGHTWKKFYENEGAGWTLVQLFRQENTKLYSLQPGRTKGRLLMDSNLDTGDVVYRYDPEFDEEECRLWRVQWDSVYISDRWAFKNLKTVYRGYVLCKPIVYDDINFSGTEKSSITSYWVEGIGDLETVWYHQLYNLLYPTDGSKRHITECWADGELIYYNVPNVLEPNYDSIEDMLSGIAAPAVRQPANDGSLHDLQGRRIGNAPKQGIYLQGGRKMMVE